MVNEKIKLIAEREWKESNNLITRKRVTFYRNTKDPNLTPYIKVEMIEIDHIRPSNIKNVSLYIEDLEDKHRKNLKIFEIAIPDKVVNKIVMQHMCDHEAKREILVTGVIKKNSSVVESAWIGRASQISKRHLK